MARIAEIASIKGGELPDVKDPKQLELAAFQVWEAITTSYLPPKAQKHKLNDVLPGKHWHGSVHAVMVGLWPKIADQHNKDLSEQERAAAHEVSIAINRYLRQAKNVVCIYRGTGGGRSTWWIADRYVATETSYLDWADQLKNGGGKVTQQKGPTLAPDTNDVLWVPSSTPTVKDTTPDPELTHDVIEEVEGATVEADSDTERLHCRHKGCTATRPLIRLLIGHERTEHGEIYNEQGILVKSYDPKVKLNDQAIENLIVESLELVGVEMSLNALTIAVRTAAPTISKKVAIEHINRLIDDPNSRVQRDPRSGDHFLYVSLKSTNNSNDDKKDQEVTKVAPVFTEPTNQIQKSPSPKDVAVDVLKRISASRPQGEDATDGSKPNMDTLVEQAMDLATLAEALRTQFQELESKASNGEREAELEAKVEELTNERDALAKRLTVLQRLHTAIDEERAALQTKLDEARQTIRDLNG